jgi:hypothetical protein
MIAMRGIMITEIIITAGGLILSWLFYKLGHAKGFDDGLRRAAAIRAEIEEKFQTTP